LIPALAPDRVDQHLALFDAIKGSQITAFELELGLPGRSPQTQAAIGRDADTPRSSRYPGAIPALRRPLAFP
jgi:hypothetical protein